MIKVRIQLEESKSTKTKATNQVCKKIGRPKGCSYTLDLKLESTAPKRRRFSVKQKDYYSPTLKLDCPNLAATTSEPAQLWERAAFSHAAPLKANFPAAEQARPYLWLKRRFFIPQFDGYGDPALDKTTPKRPDVVPCSAECGDTNQLVRSESLRFSAEAEN